MTRFRKDKVLALLHINRLQQVLVPAGDSLTARQKQALARTWRPDGYDLRPLYNAMTVSQKRLIVMDINTHLTRDRHPLDARQAELVMQLGTGSDDRYIWDILTTKQAATWSCVQVERRNELLDQPYQMALWFTYVERSGWSPAIAEK
jgi:hypothetical protein